MQRWKPFVSIVNPTYNRAQIIGRASSRHYLCNHRSHLSVADWKP
jgi:hypothetical protein